MAPYKLKKRQFLSVPLVMLLIFSGLPVGVSFADTKKSNEVTLNFVDVDLPAVTKFISDVTGKNFILDERVKGKITIIAPSKISVDAAFNLFTSVLEMKGFTVAPSGVDAYKIIPFAEAKQSGMRISTEEMKFNDSSIARLIPLKNVSSDEALRFFQPLISKDGHISSFGPGNLLLVVDAGLNIEKILALADMIDRPAASDRPEIVLLKHASADAVARLLNEGAAKSARTRPPGMQQAGIEQPYAAADQRLNAVVLFGDRSGRESMKTLISLIDVPSPESLGRINVYFLENADATEMAKVLDGMIRGTQAAKPAPGGQPPAASPFESAGGITITPEPATNALLIAASPSDFNNISQIIKQLDKRRKQVFVEAMIVEASIDKLKELGTKWRGTVTHNDEPVLIGGIGQMDSNALQSVIYGLSGMTLGGFGNFLDIPLTTVGTDGTVKTSNLTVPGFSALFSLNEFNGAVNVLSTPQILTSDNKEAEIVVGENVPFISKRERDLTTTNTVLSSIERKDVGITLRMTPQITEGDYIRLDIYQEISALKEQSESVLTTVGPSTTKRSTKTSVVVKDNQTVVIGGLMQERDEETVTKVPLLGDIPLIGWLFKQKGVSKKKTNLLVFLTPHVVKEAEGMARITQEKQRAFAASAQRYRPGELSVRFRQGTSPERAASVISGLGASVLNLNQDSGVYIVRLGQRDSVEEGMRAFAGLPEVESAEPNYSFESASGSMGGRQN